MWGPGGHFNISNIFNISNFSMLLMFPILFIFFSLFGQLFPLFERQNVTFLCGYEFFNGFVLED